MIDLACWLGYGVLCHLWFIWAEDGVLYRTLVVRPQEPLVGEIRELDTFGPAGSYTEFSSMANRELCPSGYKIESVIHWFHQIHILQERKSGLEPSDLIDRDGSWGCSLSHSAELCIYHTKILKSWETQGKKKKAIAFDDKLKCVFEMLLMYKCCHMFCYASQVVVRITTSAAYFNQSDRNGLD